MGVGADEREGHRWRSAGPSPAAGRGQGPATAGHRPCPVSPAPPPGPHRAGGRAPPASAGAAAADPPTPTPWELKRNCNRPWPPHRRTRPAGGPAPGPAERPAATRRGAQFAGGGRLAQPWREGRSMGRAGGGYLGEWKPWIPSPVPFVAWAGRLWPAAIHRQTEAECASPATSAMLRIRGDRSSLLAALAAHWSESQLAIPLAVRARRATSEAQPPIPEKRITTGG